MKIVLESRDGSVVHECPSDHQPLDVNSFPAFYRWDGRAYEVYFSDTEAIYARESFKEPNEGDKIAVLP